MSSVYDVVQAVRADMNRILLERTSAVDHALLALLTRQHYLQVGGPGTAKTMLVDALHARITGARRFKKSFNPATTADELLGPLDTLAYADRGKRVRLYARSLAEADIAFFDEVGRGNDLGYDVLLPLLDEQRTVDELGMDAPLTIPLVSAFAASNSFLTQEALDNRFLLREEIIGVQERASKIRLATSPPTWHDVQATMALDDLRAAQREAQQVPCSGEVVSAALDLEEALRGQGVSITDRMWVWSWPLIRAHAWLMGASEASLEDLGVLAASWWQRPQEKAAVQRAIYAVSNPLQQRALEIEDDALDLVGKLPHADGPEFLPAAESTNVQLMDMVHTLMREIKQSRARDKARALASLHKIHGAQKQVAAALATRIGLGHVDVSGVLTPA
jgi:MoxR-like ATPase